MLPAAAAVVYLGAGVYLEMAALFVLINTRVMEKLEFIGASGYLGVALVYRIVKLGQRALQAIPHAAYAFLERQ